MAFLAFHVDFLRAFEEIENKRQQRRQFKILRDTCNPFAFSDARFRKYYRFPAAIVQEELIPLIEPHLRIGIRTTYIPTHIRVLATLHLLAQGSCQGSVGKDCYVALAQPTISKVINEVIQVIVTHLFRHYVKFPTTREEINHVKRGFEEVFEFPNVIGAIDCTHVAIQAPPHNDPYQPALAYYNRKGYYSINTQAVCDVNLKILAINARYPGATHDAAIWQTSTINNFLRGRFEQGDHNTWLLGDSGYPLSPWLMTPIVNAPPNTPEGRYTTKHASARNTIERCFGLLKQRFRCLLKHRVLHYSHRTAGLILYSCAVLHNILIERNIDFDEEIEDENEEEDDDEENDAELREILNANRDVLATGRRIRQQLVANLNYMYR